MRCKKVFSGIFVLSVVMLLAASAGAEDIAAEKGYCPACMMFKAGKDQMPAQMRQIMDEAGITDQMLSRRNALMRAPLYADSPAVILGRARQLNLSEQQKSKLMQIQESARKQAFVVLNAQQMEKFGEIPSGPTSVKKYMKQMHSKIRPIVRKRIERGEEMPMYCPMMRRRDRGGRTRAREVTINKDELADAVEDYVRKEAVSQGGYFYAYDRKKRERLKLTLDKVHRERLSKVGRGLYFSCADFITPEGKTYDLDVFMRGTNKDNLAFSRFSVHKEDGQERYTWYERNGVWKKKAVDEPVEEHPKEHPQEHPAEPPKKSGNEHPAEHPK